MFRHALSLALTLSLTLIGACDQLATTSPEVETQDPSPSTVTDQPPGETGGAIETPEEQVETPEEQVETPEEPEEQPPAPLPGPEVIEAVLALEGANVIPQTLLHLDSSPANCDGAAVTYEWTVTQPPGSVSVLKPHAQHPNPTFEVNAAGEYDFSLLSFGQDGALCTTPHTFLISVAPETLVHIEMLWHTPGDPDESDEGPEAGADLDLHVQVVHGQQSPGWFEMPFDCFWFNANPNWGSFDPMVNDDPSLDRDDTDGAGPENFNLDILDDGAHYSVMVHSWHDHGYGDSLATVRVYIDGEQVYETEVVSLTGHDAWEVGSVKADLTFSPNVAADGGPVIIPDFTPEEFFADE